MMQQKLVPGSSVDQPGNTQRGKTGQQGEQIVEKYQVFHGGFRAARLGQTWKVGFTLS
jgi:hypothetical protein